jgi:transcriptional regulator GlxA family with amidase domain
MRLKPRSASVENAIRRNRWKFGKHGISSNEHFEEELSLPRVAKAVNVSANHLSEKFKQVTGVNFVEYIARARFEKARDLLQDRHVRISEIAFAVGVITEPKKRAAFP